LTTFEEKVMEEWTAHRLKSDNDHRRYCNSGCFDSGARLGRALGFAEAREMAAEIVVPHGTIGQEFAQEIRALEPKGDSK